MEAFGNVLSGSQSGYHLTTKEYDGDSGLYYFNARWYSTSVGRFLEVAPMPPSLEHPYSFSGQNPIYFVDPSGRFFWCTRDVDGKWHCSGGAPEPGDEDPLEPVVWEEINEEVFTHPIPSTVSPLWEVLGCLPVVYELVKVLEEVDERYEDPDQCPYDPRPECSWGRK